jgi:predicted NUDIX family NTP pyrophosphohydrolase
MPTPSTASPTPGSSATDARRPVSAGILLYRRKGDAIEVLLAHPGGPYWTRRDEGAWTIPKGGIDAGEQLFDAARREFGEETGYVPEGDAIELQPVKQRGGKVVHAWAVEGDFDPATLRSNTFSMEWPPRSGKQADFPEIDRAAWFGLEEACRRILPAQSAFIAELASRLRSSP